MRDVEFLQKSLLYQTSLGSKELFHSNIWAWLIEQDPHVFINVFFSINQLKDYKITVKREWHHRDIAILCENKITNEKIYYAVENKIKSLPTKTQLKNYTENLDTYKLQGAVFTGLINPFGKNLEVENNGLKVEWRFVGYNTIAQKIKNLLNESKEIKGLKREQILEYCKIIENIDAILNEELKTTENKLDYIHSEHIEQLRINDLYIKLKGATFIEYFEKRKGQLISSFSNYNLIVEQSFHNGKATLDFRYSNKTKDDAPWLHIGIQIEGNQYRIMAERNKFNGGKSCNEVYEEFVKHNWFDGTFDKTSGKVFGNPTSMKSTNNKKYNQYGNNNNAVYSFVYQYYDINESNNSYENLFTSIKNHLNQALEILKKL